MLKCNSCGKKIKQSESFQHNKGGRVCYDCLGSYFTCPSCDIIYDHDDENGDAGTGNCVKCERESD